MHSEVHGFRRDLNLFRVCNSFEHFAANKAARRSPSRSPEISGGGKSRTQNPQADQTVTTANEIHIPWPVPLPLTESAVERR